MNEVRIIRFQTHFLPLVRRTERVVDWLDHIPYSILAIPLRFAVGVIFWNSATAHLANWDTTLELFETDYALPFIPPHIAADLVITIETVAPILLVLGLAVRPTALILLGMTLVIQILIYPQAWPTHIQWAAMLTILLCRGAGEFSLDRLFKRSTPRISQQ
ncbi:DoxX family protein [Methylosinus sp. H3A]|uniref:DoxX family protein n=1 Tax=Methylosinus sp. H3A TaxID=2785786 RepID=UPI0018C2B6E1|nr:DoxX family protein [Methylosinus sp. H3A]MBG0808028.1 DoxX family protein [Methylosinus sp. H3A]